MAQMEKRSLRTMARQAKARMKENFWDSYKKEQEEKVRQVTQRGVNAQEAERFFAQEIERKIRGEEEIDEFYERVKWLLLQEGEVSDAIGRLTDYDVYNRLSYTEKQSYTLELSRRYLRALERFKRESIYLTDLSSRR